MLIKMYQMIFSGKIPRCRYLPSCSNYAIEAIGRLGIITGGLISLKRILRCHPWGGHGFDPVPYKKNINEIR